jgi:hypothetical protein
MSCYNISLQNVPTFYVFEQSRNLWTTQYEFVGKMSVKKNKINISFKSRDFKGMKFLCLNGLYLPGNLLKCATS